MKGALPMKRFALAAAMAAAALAAAAYDLSGSIFTAQGERTEEGRTFAVLADGSGGELLFFAEAEPDPARMKALEALYESARSWPGFAAASVRAVNYPDRLQIVLIPERFEVEGTDLVQAVPSGIQLFRGAATEYDFKVKSGQSVLRVRGAYTGWDELSAAALAAYRDPAAFIQARDPLYVLKRFAELEAKVAALEGILLGPAGAEGAPAGDGASRIERSLLAALNGGVPIAEASVAKLVELKRSEPSLSQKSAALALKAAGVKMSAKEISAVYLVKFGEY